MKFQENYRNKRKINRLTTALIGIFFYILVVLLLKTIQNAFAVGSTGMTVFNLIEFVVITLYLILFTWYNFRNASLESSKSFWKYILVIMLPLMVMTLITIIVAYAGKSAEFSSIWNKITFVIAPTLFCYIPYGFLYQFISGMPIAMFMIICLIYMVLMQLVGYILGTPSRKFAMEREQKRYEMEQEVLQQQDEMARRAHEARVKRERLRKEQSRKESVQRAMAVDEHDPLRDIVSNPIVETEAFSMVTDEMILDAINRQKIRTPQTKAAEYKTRMQRQSAKGQPDQNLSGAQSSLSSTQADHIEIQALKQMTRELEKELEMARKRLEEQEQNHDHFEN